MVAQSLMSSPSKNILIEHNWQRLSHAWNQTEATYTAETVVLFNTIRYLYRITGIIKNNITVFAV